MIIKSLHRVYISLYRGHVMVGFWELIFTHKPSQKDISKLIQRAATDSSLAENNTFVEDSLISDTARATLHALLDTESIKFNTLQKIDTYEIFCELKTIQVCENR